MLKKLAPSLMRAAGVFAVAMVISILVVSVSYVYMDGIQQDQQQARREMLRWKSKIDRSVEKNQIIDTFERNFLKLVNQGVVGEENRLSWFETIQNTAKKRNMPLAKYSISTQEILKERNLKRNYKGIDVFKSVMTLELKMAHEGDLFAMLNDLKKADGLFAVERCEIEKLSKKIVDTDNNMKAFCELGWYTFKGTKSKKRRKNAG